MQFYPTLQNHKDARLNTEMRDYAADWFRKNKDILACPTNRKPVSSYGHWSRIWEYDYVLKNIVGKTVLDIGSGTSFFSSYLAYKGYEVMCMDSDKYSCSILETIGVQNTHRDITLDIVKHWNMYDTVICISVLEHIPLMRQEAIDNMTRFAGKRVIITEDVQAHYGFTTHDFLDEPELLPWKQSLRHKIGSYMTVVSETEHIPLMSVRGTIIDV